MFRQLLNKLAIHLKLDWTYETPAAARPAEPAAPAALQVPGRLHLEELLSLGEIGYVRGIEANSPSSRARMG